MTMNRQKIKETLARAFIGFLSLAMAVCLYFLLLRIDALKNFAGWLFSILRPFLYGVIMAYLLKTPCDKLEKKFQKWFPENLKKKADMLSVVTVLTIALLITYLFTAMLLPELINSVTVMSQKLPTEIKKFTEWANEITEENSALQNYINVAVQSFGTELNKWSKTNLLPTLQNMMGSFAITVSSVVSLLGRLFIGFVMGIYILLGRKHLVRQSKAMLYAILKEEKTKVLLRELRLADRTFMGFLSGKIVDSVIVGAICYVFCLILGFTRGMENVLFISVIIGVTNMIPYFGNMIGLLIAGFLILISDPVTCLIFAIFMLILQQVDGNIIGPRLIANSVGLSGLWVLFAITLFGGLFGFVGVLFGVPVFAIIYDYVRRWVGYELKKMGKEEL